MQYPNEVNENIRFVSCPKTYSRHDFERYQTSSESWRSPAGDQTYMLLLDKNLAFESQKREPKTSDLSTSSEISVFSYGDIVAVNIEGKVRKGIVLEHRIRLDQVIVKLEGTGELLARRVKEVRLVADALRPHKVKETRPFFPWQDINDVLRRSGQKINMDTKQGQEQSEVRQAAMALTALSLSPLAPEITKENGNVEQEKFVFPPQEEARLFHRVNTDAKPRSFSFDSVPLPGRHNRKPRFVHQHSVPVTFSQYEPRSPISVSGPVSPKSYDEGFESSDDSEASESPPNKKKKGDDDRKRKVFKCMWRGCDRILASLPGIINHVRSSHLRPKNGDKYQDGEEEFYFNDVDVDSDSDLDSGSLGTCPSSDNLSVNSSENENCKSRQISVASTEGRFSERESTFVEKAKDLVNQVNVPKSTITNSSEKPLVYGKLRKNGRIKMGSSKVRPGKGKRRSVSIGDSIQFGKSLSNEGVKKCRKMYGMDSKHLWCTQCRWKKACVRFR